jgi:hypothetical protein
MTKIESSRKGAAIITMVLVLGGLSIALMALALQTQLQMKAMRNSASQQQQYNELIEFGEIILQSRLESAVSNLGAEPIVVSLPSSLANVSNPHRGGRLPQRCEVGSGENDHIPPVAR